MNNNNKIINIIIYILTINKLTPSILNPTIPIVIIVPHKYWLKL